MGEKKCHSCGACMGERPLFLESVFLALLSKEEQWYRDGQGNLVNHNPGQIAARSRLVVAACCEDWGHDWVHFPDRSAACRRCDERLAAPKCPHTMRRFHFIKNAMVCDACGDVEKVKR